MTAALVPTPVAGLRDAVSGLMSRDLSTLNSDALVQALLEVEVEVRRLAAVDHALIAELESRGVAHEKGLRDTAGLLQRVLRVAPGEAKARVVAARNLGPRRDLGGQGLEPIFPAVAAAQVEGVISIRHAQVITSLVDRLPDTVQVTHGAEVEAALVEQAGHFDPAQLAVLARRHESHLNPDGSLTRDSDHDRRRDLQLRKRDDESGELTAYLTPAALATWQAVLDSLAAPAPSADGARDLRTAGQRRHDALHDAGLRLLRSADLPEAGGAPVTVLVTMTLDQLETRAGVAVTGHGGLLSIPEALTMAAEADVIPLVLNAAGGVLAYGRSRRCASTGQRRALAARDGGCSFPGCDTPPAWTQAHHIQDWALGGRTDLPNLTLLCGYHHRTFEQHGWVCRTNRGLPEWIPPTWIDPGQRPRRNVRAQSATLR